MEQRDYSIDVLKCLAALLITYSHLEPLLGKYAALATGGSFGDCLFFFCSGYTLLLSQRKENFPNWYKRRINRIYPTVFAWTLVCACFFYSNKNLAQIIVSGGGFFVSCIMIFYAVFYFIRKYTDNYIGVSIGGFVLYYIAFSLIDKGDSDMMYRWTWSMYFLPMLMGAMLGKMQRSGKIGFRLSMWALCTLLFVSAAGYYLLMYITKPDTSLEFLKPFIVLPQLGVTFLFYLLCRTSYAEHLYQNKYGQPFIRFVGALCLEIYIVQPILIHKFALPEYFPANILIVYVIIICFAYLLKCLGCVWEQTFKEADYDWRGIVKPW